MAGELAARRENPRSSFNGSVSQESSARSHEVISTIRISRLLRVETMRPGSKAGKRCVEIQLKARIQRELVIFQFEHVDLVVSIEVNNPESIFIQKIVCHNHPFL